jgi:hypothetical protein
MYYGNLILMYGSHMYTICRTVRSKSLTRNILDLCCMAHCHARAYRISRSPISHSCHGNVLPFICFALLHRAASPKAMDVLASNPLLESAISRRRCVVATLLVCYEELRSERRRNGNVLRDFRSFEHVVMALPSNLVCRLLRVTVR